METLFTVEQVASTLQVHWQTVLTYIKAGKLRAVRLGRGYRITPKDLEDFVESIKTDKQ
jgi:excisionase family DNA binding protein